MEAEQADLLCMRERWALFRKEPDSQCQAQLLTRPRRTPTRSGPTGRLLAALLAGALLLIGLELPLRVAASPEVERAEEHLDSIKERIERRRGRLRRVSRRLNGLAARLGAAEIRLTETERQIDRVRRDIESTQARRDAVLAEIGRRSRIAYTQGPGAVYSERPRWKT